MRTDLKLARRHAIALGAAALGFAGMPGKALLAHSKPKQHEPAIGETVAGDIEKLKLNFNKAARLMKFNLYLLPEDSGFDPEDPAKDLSELTEVEDVSAPGKSFAKSHPFIVRALQPGTYFYRYIGLSKDGHTLEGHGHFYVAD